MNDSVLINRKNNLYLIISFIILSISIIFKSYYDSNGYLSPDSTNYLTLAQNLLEGNGFYIKSNITSENPKGFYAIWPIGYSYLIFLVAKITSLSVFLSSKILNIIFLGLIIFSFKVFFRSNAYIYALILFFVPYIELFTYTWSEVPFIFFLLMFARFVYLYINYDDNRFYITIGLIIISILLFLCRYIGMFAIGYLALIVFYYFFEKNFKKAAYLVIVILVVLAFNSLYLYHNYIETGYLTGTYRSQAPETNLQLVYRLIKAFFAEINVFTDVIIQNTKVIIYYLITFILEIFLIKKIVFRPLQYKKITFLQNLQINEKFSFHHILIQIGGIYLLSIIILRWISFFDDYNFRLLGPGMFLIWVGILRFLEINSTEFLFSRIKKLMVTIAILSFVFDVVFRNIWYPIQSKNLYTTTISNVLDKYKNIPAGTVVSDDNIHLRYLRIDLIKRNELDKQQEIK